MATVSQPGYYNLQALTSLGALAAGYRLYTYSAGTTTHKAAYTDSAGSVAHSYTSDGVGGQYIALDARGELPAPLYLTSGSYDLCLKTSAGATVWTRQADPEGADLESSSGSALVGFIQSGTGAVARTAQAKMRDTVSVVDFGATGDGVTDDTAEIQAAIDAVPAYGGSVYFPKGVYLISSTLTLPESRCIKLYGDGNCSVNNGFYGTVIKKSASATGAAIEVNTDASSIEYLTVQGVAGNSGDGIVIKASRVVLRDVSVFLMGNDGIRIGTDAGGENCNLWYLDNCKTKNNTRHGVYISEGAGALADANAGTCVHLDTQSNGTDGLSLNGTQLNTFVGGAYQNNGRYGVLFSQYAEYNCLIGGDIEANTSAQIRIDSGSENNYIHNMTIAYSALNIAATTENNRIEVLDHNRLISGMKFPPTQVASTDANTLDDYEEGTFTPKVRDNNGGNIATVGTTVGRYTKIGKRVFFDITLLNIDTTGLTSTNQLVVSDLPFTSETSANGVSLVSVTRDGVSATTGAVVAHIGSNATHMTFLNNTTGGLATLLVSAITSGTGDLYLSGNYIASA